MEKELQIGNKNMKEVKIKGVNYIVGHDPITEDNHQSKGVNMDSKTSFKHQVKQLRRYFNVKLWCPLTQQFK